MSNLPVQEFVYGTAPVRTTNIDGEPWFVAADVCNVLEISNAADALTRIDEDEKGIASIDTPGGDQIMLIVNEPGLYSLILGSRKPAAKPFKRWITHEVIPSIRKTGGYLRTPESYAEHLRALADKIESEERLKKEVQALKPKAEFFDQVANSKTAITMSEAAKLIYDKTKMGRNRLFAFLRDRFILDSRNIPYQDYVDNGWFRVVEQKFTKPDGSIHIELRTLVYQRGLAGMIRAAENRKALVEVSS